VGILSKKTQLLKAWGLKENPPFRGVPSDVTELMKVFVNRDREMETTILTLDDSENVLVRGMTGIGKTAFIMATLYRMQQEVKDLKEEILPIHIRQFVGGTRNEFYQVILYALAKQLSPRNQRAKEILYAVTGEQITKGKNVGISGGMEIQATPLFKATVGGNAGGEKSKLLEIEHPEHFVDELLDIAAKKYRRVVIAVDDLEKYSNQGNIKLMFESSLDLLRDHRCSFILTGRTLTILEDVYTSGLDIFNETLPLQPLSPENLRLIAIRTLNLVRYQPDENSVSPFNDEVINIIASKSFGIPRQFILICGRILKIAIQRGVEELTEEGFQQTFEQLQEEIAGQDVPPDIRRVLYLGLQQGGFSISRDADLDEVFDVLGVTTLKQFIDFADNLVQQDLLQRLTDNCGEVIYKLAPGIEKLAESGAIVKSENNS
jgi:Cdc6-like AAA superfamily ATPase